MKILLITLVVFHCFNISAKTKGEVTSLNIPRFVSIKSDDVNLRVGPSINYPIIIKYIQKNLPIEIIDEHDDWRKIKDFKNQIGWIHKSLLKGERYAIITSLNLKKYNLYNHPNGKIIGFIKKNNIVKLKKCIKDWCLINYDKYKGWILKDDLWGIYKKEIYNVGYTQPIIEFYWKLSLKIHSIFNYLWNEYWLKR